MYTLSLQIKCLDWNVIKQYFRLFNLSEHFFMFGEEQVCFSSWVWSKKETKRKMNFSDPLLLSF